MLTRRQFLTVATVAVSLPTLRAWASDPATRLSFGTPIPFSYEGLVEKARQRAQGAYVPPPPLPQDVLDRIDYDAHGKIRFKPELALFADGPGEFPVTFFHLGRFFRIPQQLHVLDPATGTAREIIYDERYFDMPPDSPAHELPRGSGFAGFRFQESRLAGPGGLDWKTNDWVAFLGASYFRAIGELYQYGLSARGVAVNPAVHGKAEEFPAFREVYFEPPASPGSPVVVYALLEGPSLTGAYRFVMRRETGVIMDVTATLFLRENIDRLGLAPLTSMYWFSEKARPGLVDWRPEVHDSDGLALWTHTGERIWRPLNNPPRTIVSSFVDNNPQGFGLLQRDREFDHYLDGVHYQRRPSLWVEPLGNWGPGAVQLIEIPTDDEIHDNIVAMWVPEEPALKGNRYDLSYRLHWLADEPYPSPLARTVATRIGRGGQPGQPRPQGVTKFMVEFLGGPLTTLAFGERPEAVLWASQGKFSYVFTEAVPDDIPGHWRAQFDFTPDRYDEPIEMRLYLRSREGEPLSETWAYQFHPQATAPK